MSRERVPPEKRHRARLLAGAFFREPARHRGGVMRAFLIVGGILLILVGLALVVLPVVPGFPLVIIGMLMLAGASAWVRARLNGLERRLPTGMRARLRRLARKEQEVLEHHLHPNGTQGGQPKRDATDPSPQ